MQPQAKERHHLIISGTGRAGTTFLVQLFSALDLQTGYKADGPVNADCNAGMEWDLAREDAPYVVKSPELSDRLLEILDANPHIKIDRAIIPVRDLYSAAESRRAVARGGSPKFLVPRSGILGRVRKPEEQESILAQRFFHLMYALVKHDVPVTLLLFPDLATNPEYLYRKLQDTLPNVPYERFLAAFKAVSRPEAIHQFAK